MITIQYISMDKILNFAVLYINANTTDEIEEILINNFLNIDKLIIFLYIVDNKFLDFK